MDVLFYPTGNYNAQLRASEVSARKIPLSRGVSVQKLYRIMVSPMVRCYRPSDNLLLYLVTATIRPNPPVGGDGKPRVLASSEKPWMTARRTQDRRAKRLVSMALTRADMAESLFNELGLNKWEARELVNLFFEELTASLAVGKQVKLAGFGNFVLRDKSERPGRNPKTGEEIPITARRVVTFRPGEKLRARVEAYAGTGE